MLGLAGVRADENAAPSLEELTPLLLFEACRNGDPARVLPFVVRSENYVSGEAQREEQTGDVSDDWSRSQRDRVPVLLMQVHRELEIAGIDWRQSSLIDVEVYARSQLGARMSEYSRTWFTGEEEFSTGPQRPAITPLVAAMGRESRIAHDYWLALRIGAAGREATIYWLVRRTPRGPRLLGHAIAVAMSIEDCKQLAAWHPGTDRAIDQRIAKLIVRNEVPFIFFEAAAKSGVLEDLTESLILETPERFSSDRADTIWLVDEMLTRTELIETALASLMFVGERRIPVPLEPGLTTVPTSVALSRSALDSMNNDSMITATIGGRDRRFMKLSGLTLAFKSPSSRRISFPGFGRPILVEFIDDIAAAITVDGHRYSKDTNK